MPANEPNEGHLRITVDELAYGLFVADLDRPWSEVPVMFQGFEVRDDEELEILRRHCEYVYVDRVRSRQDALDALKAETDQTSPGSSEAPTPVERRDVADAFSEARQPDKDAFRELVSEAHENRAAALDLMDGVMSSLASGEILDTESARAAVSDLAGTVSRNTTASLWLTNLRERDEYLTRHAVNACVLMLAYGVHQGFARPELERMAMGTLLMDVGMAKLPDAILAKTGSLSADEMRLMMQHPSDGVEIVKAAGYVPRETVDIIQMHHERLDGSGYPRGLQGTQIPLHARLAGMLDTYDAMTSPRVFQDATPADRVLQYLLNESETTFGSILVQQLIRCIGLYPVGSLIELDNGAVGIVIGTRPDARVRPTVLLVRTPDGDFYDKRILLNLAADPDATGPSARTVRRVLDPVYEDIDVPGIVAFEFGVSE